MSSIEKTLKIGDKVIITKSNTDKDVGQVGVVVEIDPEGFDSGYLFAIKYKLDSGNMAWGRVIPYTELVGELL